MNNLELDADGMYKWRWLHLRLYTACVPEWQILIQLMCGNTPTYNLELILLTRLFKDASSLVRVLIFLWKSFNGDAIPQPFCNNVSGG